MYKDRRRRNDNQAFDSHYKRSFSLHHDNYRL